MTFNTRTTYTQKPVWLAIQLWGAADRCTMSQVPISIPWHREYWNIQLKAHLKPHSIKSSNTPAWLYQLLVSYMFNIQHQQTQYWISSSGILISALGGQSLYKYAILSLEMLIMTRRHFQYHPMFKKISILRKRVFILTRDTKVL